MKPTDRAKPPRHYRQRRSTLWVLLWLVALAWLMTIMGMPSGLVNFWVFGFVSVACFIGAWAINLRMVRMLRRREDGLCWNCGYHLTGIESANCPECGVEV